VNHRAGWRHGHSFSISIGVSDGADECGARRFRARVVDDAHELSGGVPAEERTVRGCAVAGDNADTQLHRGIGFGQIDGLAVERHTQRQRPIERDELVALQDRVAASGGDAAGVQGDETTGKPHGHVGAGRAPNVGIDRRTVHLIVNHDIGQTDTQRVVFGHVQRIAVAVEGADVTGLRRIGGEVDFEVIVFVKIADARCAGGRFEESHNVELVFYLVVGVVISRDGAGGNPRYAQRGVVDNVRRHQDLIELAGIGQNALIRSGHR
jgi:hypothetical protein